MTETQSAYTLQYDFSLYACDKPSCNAPSHPLRFMRRAAGMSTEEMAAVDGVTLDEITDWLKSNDLMTKYTQGFQDGFISVPNDDGTKPSLIYYHGRAYIDTASLCLALHLNSERVHGWIKSGRVPCINRGKWRYWNVGDVVRAIKTMKKGAH